MQAEATNRPWQTVGNLEPFIKKEFFAEAPPVLLDGNEPLAALKKDCADSNAGGQSPAVSASVWLAEPDTPEEPIIRGLFDVGDRVAIVGQSKARKSFFALQMAVSISVGIPFLRMNSERRSVLLLNGEIRSSPYKKRVRRMAERLGEAPSCLSGLHIMNTCEDQDPATFASVLDEAKRIGAQVVVCDPTYLLIDGDESDQSAVKEAVKEMKRFTAEGITLVMVFHAAKGAIGDRQVIDRVAGSGIFARDASTLISLCEHAEAIDCVVMTAVTRNYPPVEPSVIRFDDGAFILAQGLAALEKNSRTRARRQVTDEEIREAFTESGPQTYSIAVKMLRCRFCVGENAAKVLMSRAASGGILTATPKGRSVIYELAKA